MEMQTPSKPLNDFLSAPNGGKTISEVGEEIAPTIDVRELIYEKRNHSFNFPLTGAFTSQPLNLTPGTYRMRGILTGYFRNGVNAGEVYLYLTALGGAIQATVDFLDDYVIASAVKSYQLYFDVEFVYIGGATLAFAFAAPAAGTGGYIVMSFSTIRIG